ncbi:MAG: hypothetical protein IPK33_22050 [Gemmatimonadetes bacterium]|nr:hypothetical protein [Gemmatimonadota bacterium]
MFDTGTLAQYAPENEAQRATLEGSWSQGELREHMQRLLAFVHRNREDILQLAGDAPDAGSMLEATKRRIVDAGAVHPPSEMRDQVKAIQDEIWIRGERGDYDREHIAHEWTSRHAADWRRWRLMEYLFVVDRCAADIVARLAT